MGNITQDVIVLNDYAERRVRTTGAGTKSRVTLSIKAEPILHDLSETNLGAGPAAAIQAAIQKQIQNITEVADPATILRRRNARRLLEGGIIQENRAARNTWTGKKWIAEGKGHLVGVDGLATIARYSGGRTGAMPPTGSVRLFNDSGRLAKSIFVRQNPQEENWTINVAANRLDESTFTQAAFMRMLQRLYAHVPVLANPLKDEDVLKAITQGIGDVAIKAIEKGENLRAEIAKRRLAAVQQIASTLAGML
jgi:hypothetical protein